MGLANEVDDFRDAKFIVLLEYHADEQQRVRVQEQVDAYTKRGYRILNEGPKKGNGAFHDGWFDPSTSADMERLVRVQTKLSTFQNSFKKIIDDLWSLFLHFSFIQNQRSLINTIQECSLHPQKVVVVCGGDHADIEGPYPREARALYATLSKTTYVVVRP